MATAVTAEDDSVNRRELAGFLRSRRERITPAEVGLPAGPRRRIAGLRREEVAVLAGLSPTWYTYLEQGRDIHPSPEVLDSLARVLGLTEDERRYIHKLATGRTAGSQPLQGDVSAEELVNRLVRSSDDMPYPVYGLDHYCDVLAWNRAAAEWYTDFGLLPPDRRNMLRWLFSPDGRCRIGDWENDVADVLARWRALSAPWSGDGKLATLVDDLRRQDEDFGRMWDGHGVRELRSRVRTLHHPELGPRAFRAVTVQGVEFAPCLVVFHMPAQPQDPTF
ncbi:helix-turn-helix transcriptional regulator [Kibdelosporangium persicum]|uniref:helix-turn-helix transcriptional regulator n=1 Tax=Kibdelosporangium persicum TaxID=2698649 RepID=UPI001FE839E3|nr:helix-turn-helix transcriptional regulator [Kibdelosporangium persicum]